MVLAFQSQSIFVLKVDLIFSCFATYEFLLYACLISRRVVLLKSAFSPLLMSGLAVYLLTRLVQVVLLVGLFVQSYVAMRATQKTIALYWVSMVLCLALVVLQSYTFFIYHGIWKGTTVKTDADLRLPTHLTATSTQFSRFRTMSGTNRSSRRMAIT